MTASRPLLDELNAHAPRAIVIGGSAGSIDALRTLVPVLAGDVPVLVVVHIATDAKSDWSKVFPSSTLVLREAEDKEVAVPGTLFFAPPDYHLLVDAEGTLSLSVEPPVHHSRPAIDVLFEAAAWAYRERLLGIVLSGANADGADGLAAIHRAGGLCWVQSPESSPAPTMPRAALLAVPKARALTLDEMAEAFRGRA